MLQKYLEILRISEKFGSTDNFLMKIGQEIKSLDRRRRLDTHVQADPYLYHGQPCSNFIYKDFPCVFMFVCCRFVVYGKCFQRLINKSAVETGALLNIDLTQSCVTWYRRAYCCRIMSSKFYLKM